MLRVLVYSFATVAMLLCIAAVGVYIYIVRLPIDEYVDRGKEFVADGERLVEQSRGAKRTLEEVRDGIERLARVRPGNAPASPAETAPLPPVPAPAAVSTDPAPAARSAPPVPPQAPAVAETPPPPASTQPQADAVPPQPPVQQFTVYEVQQRDTLYGIARRLLDKPAEWKTIAETNGMKPPYRIYPGMKLKIPARSAAPAVAESAPPQPRATAESPAAATGPSASPAAGSGTVYLTGGRGL
ncbi:MAG: LysM peptidoglycan-binding domain-containing protein [Planctomycetes bacterium]|nr:LysM peptidoglycan-binding domain-containing protein [Planctomycetota bacterium]